MRVDLTPRVAALLEASGPSSSAYDLKLDQVAVEDSSRSLKVRVYLIEVRGTKTGAARKLDQLRVEVLAGRRSE